MLSGVQSLLEALAQTPALVCTVSRDGVVSELFLNDAVQKVAFDDTWATIEFPGWHVHADVRTITQVRFVETTGQDQSVSVFVSLDDSAGQPVLRFYFPHASHTSRTYTPEELALFETVKKRYETVLARKG